MEGRLFRGLEEPRKVEVNLGVVGPCGINQRKKGTMKLYRGIVIVRRDPTAPALIPIPH